MVLKPKLLEILVCPKCKGKLIYKEKENKLECEKDKLLFRVEGDIPVLLLEDAESY